jgi:hypothetical protein
MVCEEVLLEEYSVDFEDIHGYKEVSPATTTTYLTSGFYSEIMAHEYPWKIHQLGPRAYEPMVRHIEGGSCEIESESLVCSIGKAIISLFKRG